MTDARYEAGQLPWGWWLRVCGSELEDENGRKWGSVRDALWQGKLGFCAVHFAPEQHELMLRVLSSIDMPWAKSSERPHDLFNGDMMFWRFYTCWLASIGMIGGSNSPGQRTSPLDSGLTPEGRSVLLMLRATRDPAWEPLPMAEIVDAVASSRFGTVGDAREAALRAFERGIGLRRHVFARERVGRSHLVTLTGMSGDARMPVRRVAWSISFADPATRDDLFAWFATRVGRWDDWGEMAHRDGADAFGQHLLGLLIASRLSGPIQ